MMMTRLAFIIYDGRRFLSIYLFDYIPSDVFRLEFVYIFCLLKIQYDRPNVFPHDIASSNAWLSTTSSINIESFYKTRSGSRKSLNKMVDRYSMMTLLTTERLQPLPRSTGHPDKRNGE